MEMTEEIKQEWLEENAGNKELERQDGGEQ